MIDGIAYWAAGRWWSLQGAWPREEVKSSGAWPGGVYKVLHQRGLCDSATLFAGCGCPCPKLVSLCVFFFFFFFIFWSPFLLSFMKPYEPNVENTGKPSVFLLLCSRTDFLFVPTSGFEPRSRVPPADHVVLTRSNPLPHSGPRVGFFFRNSDCGESPSYGRV
jgi:hypothetical protein